MDILVIMGPPYSGKGTQCELLEKSLGYKHISTGDRCRAEVKASSKIGKILAAGDYVPDGIMKDLFGEILKENLGSKGVIIDGYPRTAPQVDDLIELTQSMGLPIQTILNIEVGIDALLLRAAERAKNSDRADDKDPATHIKRIRLFEKSTLPAIDYLKGKLNVKSISGIGSIEEINKAIEQVLVNQKIR